MKKETEMAAYRPIRCSKELDETLGLLAAQKHTSKSEVLRDLVNRGLIASGKTVDDYRYSIIKEAVQEIMKPEVERLAAISAKATQISGAAFFMGMYAATCNCPPAEQEELTEAAAIARQLGIQYLKLKNQDVDTFLKTGIQNIIDKES